MRAYYTIDCGEKASSRWCSYTYFVKLPLESIMETSLPGGEPVMPDFISFNPSLENDSLQHGPMVVNQSGGADVDAANVQIDGDAVGRDKIETAVEPVSIAAIHAGLPAGGIDVDAANVQIDGNVVGRDKIRIHIKPSETVNIHSGMSISNKNWLPEPLPLYDPKLTLETPQGAVPPDSPFYIERTADRELRQQIFGQGTITTIRAGRQSGKTSLLMRGIQAAKQENQTVIYLDFQAIETAQRETLNGLLQHLAKEIAYQVGIELKTVDNIWKSSLGALGKFNQLLEDVVLPSAKACLLAMDETDQLLGAAYKTDFFGMVRSWNSLRAFKPVWRKLNVVMIISTHPHLLIDDPYQSPFNVATSIDLKDFDEAQVRELDFRHGRPITDDNLDSAMNLLGGHPYLTRQALYSLVNQPLTWSELAQTATSDQGPFGRHLRFYRDELRKQPQLVKALTHVIERREFEDETMLYRLAAAGLVKEVEGRYVCRCGLYEAYFKDKLR